MTRAYSDFLQDILEVSAKAQQFVEGVDYAEFESNDEKIYAVIRALEVIGEAVKSIPKQNETVILKYPGRRWPECVTS